MIKIIIFFALCIFLLYPKTLKYYYSMSNTHNIVKQKNKCYNYISDTVHTTYVNSKIKIMKIK